MYKGEHHHHYHFTSLWRWLSQVLGAALLGGAEMSILSGFLRRGDCSALVREYAAPRFVLEKFRPRSIITVILSACWCSLWCLQPRVCDKEKLQLAVSSGNLIV